MISGIFIGFCVAVVLSYFLLMIFFTSGWFLLKEESTIDIDTLKKISVIVPFRNEEKNLTNIINSLVNQTYNKALAEFIFVDDNSDDGSFALCETIFGNQGYENFRLIRLAEGDGLSKKAALRKGIENANGEIIITTDADCIMPKHWIDSIVCYFEKTKTDLISAPVKLESRRDFFGKLQQIEFSSLIACGAGAVYFNKGFLANGANLAFRKSIFGKLKDNDLYKNFSSGDDVFLMLAARKNHKVVFLKSSDAVVSTDAPETIRKFFSQRIRWASKSKGYRDFISTATSLIVFVFCTFLLFTGVLAMVDSSWMWLFTVMFLAKLVADFPIIMGVMSFFREKKQMLFYVPMQLLYPLYVFIVGIFSLFLPFTWKGRRLKK
jgi:cellulose synthase/poly-beta-1,6-N-acetylglucosamine synthase-like glycosyltransferase